MCACVCVCVCVCVIVCVSFCVCLYVSLYVYTYVCGMLYSGVKWDGIRLRIVESSGLEHQIELEII